MSNLYEEYGLEVEAEYSPKDGPIPPSKNTPSKKKKSGGWLKAGIALLLGIVIALGGIAGGGYYALTQPVRPTIELIGGFAGLNYEEKVQNKLLSEEYENKTLLDIGKELLSVIKDKNLAGINNISPAVGDYLDKMVNNLNTQFGVEMDTDKLLSTEFAELPTYLGETFRTTPLGNMLKATSGADQLEPILMEVCYGQEGIHYTIDEATGEIVMLDGHTPATFETFGSSPNALINNISLAAVLPPNANDALMLSMAYGREDVTFQLERDEDGNVVLDANNHPIVNMLPLYFEKSTLAGEEVWVDYTGSLVLCNVAEPDENGFQRMEKTSSYEGSGTEIYYLKETHSDGKFYAYKAPADDAEPALFSKTMIGHMAEDSSKLINDMEIGAALKVNYQTLPEPHKILFSLAYGTEGADYIVDKPNPEDKTTWTIQMINGARKRTIGDLRDRGTDIINDVAISDIMSAKSDDALGMYLLYGKKGIHYAVNEDGSFDLLQKYIAISDDGTRVYNEYGELMAPKTETSSGYVLNGENTTFTDGHGITYKYVVSDPAKTITTNDGTGEAKVYYLTHENGDPAMFTPHSLGDLAGSDNLISRLTDRLTLSEILGEESIAGNKFLRGLGDSTVNGLPNAISNLTIDEVFTEEIYIDCMQYSGPAVNSVEFAPDGSKIVINDGDWYYVDDNDGWHRSEGEKAIRGTWKYLLTDEYGVLRTDYKVATEMNSLINNMTRNVKTATLYNMHNDGVMTFEESMMQQPTIEEFPDFIPTAVSDAVKAKLVAAGITKATYPTLGSMPTDVLLSYLNIILALFNTTTP